MPDEPRYWLHSTTKEKGPYTLAKLQKLTESGAVTDTDWCRFDKLDEPTDYEPVGKVLDGYREQLRQRELQEAATRLDEARRAREAAAERAEKAEARLKVTLASDYRYRLYLNGYDLGSFTLSQIDLLAESGLYHGVLCGDGQSVPWERMLSLVTRYRARHGARNLKRVPFVPPANHYDAVLGASLLFIVVGIGMLIYYRFSFDVTVWDLNGRIVNNGLVSDRHAGMTMGVASLLFGGMLAIVWKLHKIRPLLLAGLVHRSLPAAPQ